MDQINDKDKISNLVLVDRFVHVGTHQLHVLLVDTNSEYTAVLEAGGGKDATAYQEILEPLAQRIGCRDLLQPWPLFWKNFQYFG